MKLGKVKNLSKLNATSNIKQNAGVEQEKYLVRNTKIRYMVMQVSKKNIPAYARENVYNIMHIKNPNPVKFAISVNFYLRIPLELKKVKDIFLVLSVHLLVL